MIKESEIMLGNWYKGNTLLPDEIYQWDKTAWYCIEEYGYSLADVSPIPLNPDIIKALSLPLSVIDGLYTIPGGLMIKIPPEHKLIAQNYFVVVNQQLFHIEYVHQLQNIVRVLTGEELEIKL